MLAPSGRLSFEPLRNAEKIGNAPLSSPLRLRPVEFEISALSSISITTVRMSPRCAARRSPNSESRAASPERRGIGRARRVGTSSRHGGRIHRVVLVAALQRRELRRPADLAQLAAAGKSKRHQDQADRIIILQ